MPGSSTYRVIASSCDNLRSRLSVAFGGNHFVPRRTNPSPPFIEAGKDPRGHRYVSFSSAAVGPLLARSHGRGNVGRRREGVRARGVPPAAGGGGRVGT